ncbi:MAG: ribosome maturation factor RimM [Proteobacteria bacterium]|nr:ribosome maturation factor RimM [Pseudomonadota bacterium]
MNADRQLTVGRIVGIHGVDGWVKLESFTEPRLRIFSYRPWRLMLAGTESEVASAQGHEQGKGIVGKLPGCDDRDAAARLVGATIQVPRSALPKPKRGEYYWTDLEGLAVVNADGVDFGKVSHLFATGANDVLVVQGERERLIPYVTGQFVKEVNLQAGRITVDWDPEF